MRVSTHSMGSWLENMMDFIILKSPIIDDDQCTISELDH